MPRSRTGTPVYKSGRWQAKLTDAEGNRVYIDLLQPDLPNTPAGKAKARAITLKLAKGTDGKVLKKTPQPLPPTTKLEDLAKRWLDLIKSRGSRDGNRPGTQLAKASVINCQIIPALGKLDIAELTETQIKVFVRKLANKLSPKKARYVYTVLKTIIDDAMDEGWVKIDQNPANQRTVRKELPKCSVKHSSEIEVIPAEDINKFIHCDEIDPELRLMVLLGATTGMRTGELFGLERKSIVSKNGILVFEVSKQFGKFGFCPTKTRESLRAIPVHPELEPVEAWLKMAGRVLDGIGRHYYAQSVANGVVAAKITNPFAIRFLRHTFATMLGAQGVDGAAIERLLGHTGSTVRMRHYQAADLKHLADSIGRIPLICDRSVHVTSLESYLMARKFTTTKSGNSCNRSSLATTPIETDAIPWIQENAHIDKTQLPASPVVKQNHDPNDSLTSGSRAPSLPVIEAQGTIQGTNQPPPSDIMAVKTRLAAAIAAASEVGNWSLLEQLVGVLKSLN